jgi:hypothetical protein
MQTGQGIHQTNRMNNSPLEIIARTIGPARWYWQTFPAVTGTTGQRYVWSEHGASGPNAHTVALGPEVRPDRLRLAVNTYVRVFPIPPAQFGLWYRLNGTIRILGFDPERLADFAFSELPEEFQATRRLQYYARGEPEFQWELKPDLPEGVHHLDLPAGLASVTELLVIANCPPASPADWTPTEDEPADVILAVQPAQSQVQVFPQKWFTGKQFDLGYQWITRVARDPETGRFIGDGMRIGPFALDEDGCHLEGWLAE